MKVVFGLILVICSVGAAAAKELSINERDQTAIGQICELAARAPNVPLEVVAGIASWCVQWGKRVNEPAKIPEGVNGPTPPNDKK